ncbi:MAG TPA: sigma-70 family RNA polymerase sigma factor [Armatimonadota bacterium]|nr:sigma-70 family RNA polymerase sigma factor [Armatimonadota bacterium]
MPHQDETDLIRRCQAGDREAFDRLVERYQVRIYNYAFSLSRNRDDAQDVAQEAFVRAWVSLRSFRGDASFSTWLTRITRNLFLDIQKKRKHDPRLSLDELMEASDNSPVREAADESAGPEEIALTRERQDVVRKAVSELAKEHREIITLYDMQDFSYEEITVILKLPMGTVKSRLNRARRALREKLEPVRELLDV